MMRFLFLLLTVLSCSGQGLTLRSPLRDINPPGSSVPTYYGITNQPYMWVKADAQSFSDGDAVTTAVDSSGNNRPLTQATTATKPKWKANQYKNGLPGFYFEDAARCLTNPNVALSTFTIFIVSSNASGHAILIEHSANAYVSDGCALYSTTPCSAEVRRGSGANGTGKDVGSTWLEIGAYVTRWDYDGNHAGHTLKTNGVSATVSDCSYTANPGTATVTDALNVGARNNGGSLGLFGTIGEILIYTPQLSSGNGDTVEAGIKSKYGL